MLTVHIIPSSICNYVVVCRRVIYFGLYGEEIFLKPSSVVLTGIDSLGMCYQKCNFFQVHRTVVLISFREPKIDLLAVRCCILSIRVVVS